MIQITLTPEQLKLIDEATETVDFVDARGQVLARVNIPARKSIEKNYASIPELLDDLGEWDDEELKRRLEGFQATR